MTRPVVVRVHGDIRGLEQALNRIDGRLGRSQQVMSTYGKAVAGAFAVGSVVRGAGAVVGAGAKYLQVLKDIEAQGGATKRQVAALDATSMKLGLEFGTGATESAKAAAELVRAGLNIRDIVGGAQRSTVTLASSSTTDLTVAGEGLARAANIFKIAGADTGKIADYYQSFANKTQGSVEGLIMAMSQGSQAAKLLNYDLRETVTTQALLEMGGVKGQDAGTSMKTAFLRATSTPGRKAANAYDLDLFDKSGDLKRLDRLSAELRHELGDLNASKRTQALQKLGGTDGFRTWAAIMAKTPGQIRQLRTEIGAEGVAAETAAKRNTGAAQSIEKLKAAREAAMITVGRGAADQLDEAAKVASAGLADPKVQRELERTGDILAGAMAGGIRAVRDGLADGTITRTLDQVVGTGERVAETLGDFAHVGGELLQVVSQIPAPVMQAVAAFALWRRASLALAAPLAAVGARGANALAVARGLPQSGAAGAAAASAGRVGGAAGGPVPVGGGRLGWADARVAQTQAAQAAAASRAQSIASQQQMVASQRRLADAQMRAALAPTGYQRMAGRADATIVQRQLAADRAAAQTSARVAAEQRSAALAAQRATRVAGARQGAGGALIGAGVGAAMADNFQTAIIAGAAAGSIAGPWGAAGGAVAAAAGVGIKKLLASGARKEAEELGRQIATGTGAYLAGESRKGLVEAKKKMDDAAPPVPKSLPVGTVETPEYRRMVAAARERQMEGSRKFQTAARDYGSKAASAYVGDRLKAMDPKFISAAGSAREFEKIKGLNSRAAREAAAAPIAAFLDQASKDNPKLKGAGLRFLKLINEQVPKGQKISAGVQLELDIKSTARGARNSLEKALGRQEIKIQGLTKINPKDMGFDQLVWHANKRMTELRKIMREKSGTQEAARAGEELARLSRAVGRYADDAEPAFKRAGDAGIRTLDALNEKAKTTALTLGGIAPAMDGLTNTLADVLPDVVKPPKKPKANRNGGRNFQVGGWAGVPIKASPGELVIYPDGSGGIIPGARVAADSVSMVVPPKTAILTDGQQAALAAGASVDQALMVNAPHFVNGGKVEGKASWFGGPHDASTRGRKTALGTSADIPGVAIRPGATFQSGRPYLGGYWDVHLAGRHSVLRQIDLGPHQSTGKRIDITSAALSRFGFGEKTFPTGATGWAAWLGKDRAKALARAGKAADGSAIASDIMVGRSVRNVAGLIESTGFERGRAGAGAGPAKAIAEALAQVQTTRSIEQQSSSLGATTGSGPMARMVSKANEIARKGYQYAWGGGHGALGVPGRGSRHAHGRGKVGLGFDCSGSVSAVLGAGGLLKAPLTSGALMSWGKAGSGKNLAVYADPAHAIMRLGNRHWGTSNENPKGGPGWISRNTMQGRGAVRTAPGFRRGGVAGMPMIVRGGVRMPLMEEGFRGGGVARFKTGGVTGTSLLSMAGSGGDLQSRFERVVAAIEGATYAQMERIRREVQAAANAPGTKRTRAIAQATLSAIDDTMDARIGSALRRTDFLQSAHAQNMDVLSDMQTVRGTAGTEQGYREQAAQAQRFVDQAPGARDELLKAQARAQRAYDRNPNSATALAALTAAKDEVKDFDNDVRKAGVQVVEFGRSAAEAAKAQRDAEQAFRDAMTEGAAAWAEMTGTTKDDAAALRERGDRAQERAWTAALRGDEAQRKIEDAAAESFRRQANAMDRRDGLSELDEDASRAANTDDGGVDDADVRNRKLANAKKRAAEADADPGSTSEERQFWQNLIKQVTDEVKAGNAEQAASVEATNALLKQQLSESQATNRVLVGQNAGQLARVTEQKPRANTAWGGRSPWGFG